jgi:hypothetical protein
VHEYKRSILGALPDCAPLGRAVSVEADLALPSWSDSLVASGFDASRPAVFLLEGLIGYLTEVRWFVLQYAHKLHKSTGCFYVQTRVGAGGGGDKVRHLAVHHLRCTTFACASTSTARGFVCAQQRQCHCLALFQDEARALLSKVASLCAPGSDVLITFIGKVDDGSKHGMRTKLVSLLWGLLPNLGCGPGI